jgi:hypothetical protein
MKNKQATIVKIEELPKLRRSLPKSLLQAAGLLRHKYKALKRHYRQIRKEWSNYSSLK